MKKESKKNNPMNTKIKDFKAPKDPKGGPHMTTLDGLYFHFNQFKKSSVGRN